MLDYLGNAWSVRPVCTAPRKNMARGPRQTTKGNRVKSRMGAVRPTPLCLWSIQEKGQMPCWDLGLEGPRPRTPGFWSTTRIRTRGFSPRVFFARWRENAKMRSNCAREMTEPTVPTRR